MKMIHEVDLAALETFLRDQDNLADNLNQIRRFARHWLMLLTEEEFFGLVFLQIDGLLAICPRGNDRTLRAVAERANRLGQPNLCPNWNLNANLSRMRELMASKEGRIPPSLIRESNPNKLPYGPFYIQDGSHRALAYASLVITGEVRYEDRLAYCSMSEPVCDKLKSKNT
jgi:hypothetical protein